MPDAIPGARYKDTVLETEMVCNGVTTEPKGDDEHAVVVLEYDGFSETTSVPLSTFRQDETIELVEQP